MPRNPDSTGADALGWAWGITRCEARADVRAASRPKPAAAHRSTGTERMLTGALAGLAGLGGLALAGGFFAFVASIDVSEPRRPALPADGIVALTGGSQRIEDAIDLLAAGYGRRLLITGVNERTSRDEIARLNPRQGHWIACCVDLDYRARNTVGNAVETGLWMRRNHFDSVAVVTANYHMPRTMVELGHALPDEHRVVPHAVIPDGFDAAHWWRHPASARLLAGEYAKFLAAWVRTRVRTAPETRQDTLTADSGFNRPAAR